VPDIVRVRTHPRGDELASDCSAAAWSPTLCHDFVRQGFCSTRATTTTSASPSNPGPVHAWARGLVVAGFRRVAHPSLRPTRPRRHRGEGSINAGAPALRPARPGGRTNRRYGALTVARFPPGEQFPPEAGVRRPRRPGLRRARRRSPTTGPSSSGTASRPRLKNWGSVNQVSGCC